MKCPVYNEMNKKYNDRNEHNKIQTYFHTTKEFRYIVNVNLNPITL